MKPLKLLFVNVYGNAWGKVALCLPTTASERRRAGDLLSLLLPCNTLTSNRPVPGLCRATLIGETFHVSHGITHNAIFVPGYLKKHVTHTQTHYQPFPLTVLSAIILVLARGGSLCICSSCFCFAFRLEQNSKNIFLGEFWRRRRMKNYVCKTVGIFSIKASIVLFSVFFLPVFYHLPKVFVFN